MELIRNNYDIIRSWIESQDIRPYEAFHIMWLKRRKDGVTDRGSQAGKHWYIHNVQELEQIKPSMLEHVSRGGRIVIGVNAKDLREVNAKLAYTLAMNAISNNFPFAGVIYPSVFDETKPSRRGVYLVDVDRAPGESDEAISARTLEYVKFLEENCLPAGEKVSLVLQSKTGYHILFKRCLYQKFTEVYGERKDIVSIHKDENTPIYIMA